MNNYLYLVIFAFFLSACSVPVSNTNTTGVLTATTDTLVRVTDLKESYDEGREQWLAFRRGFDLTAIKSHVLRTQMAKHLLKVDEAFDTSYKVFHTRNNAPEDRALLTTVLPHQYNQSVLAVRSLADLLAKTEGVSAQTKLEWETIHPTLKSIRKSIGSDHLVGETYAEQLRLMATISKLTETVLKQL